MNGNSSRDLESFVQVWAYHDPFRNRSEDLCASIAVVSLANRVKRRRAQDRGDPVVAADWLSSGVAWVGAPQEPPGVEVELAPRQQVPAPEPALRSTGSAGAEELPAWQEEAEAQCPSWRDAPLIKSPHRW